MARLAVVGLALALIGAGVWFTVGPGAGPPISACGVAALAPATSAHPDPLIGRRSVRWAAGALPDGEERNFHDVVSFQGGFVAVGNQSRGPEAHAFVLRSVDGLTWEGQPDDYLRFADDWLEQLVVIEDRLFGLGSVSTNDRGGSRAVVWISDDGLSWRQARGSFNETSVSSIAAGADGMLLIGSSNADGVLRAWRSATGDAWEVAELDLPVPRDVVGLGPVTALGDGWVSVGSIRRGADSPAAPVVWRSGDGVTWTCDLLDAADWPVAYPYELHRSGDTWLAVGVAGQVCGFGGSCPGYPIGWASDDGLAWSGAILDGEPIGTGGYAYAASDIGFVAVGYQQTWAATDGGEWARMPDGGTDAALAGPADTLAVTDDGRIVAAGTDWIAVGELSP